MTKVLLQYTIEFGKNDYGDWVDWEVELDGEEVVYLNAINAGKNPNDCKELMPILENAREEIAEVEAENFEEYDMLDEDDEIPEGWDLIVEFKCDEEDE